MLKLNAEVKKCLNCGEENTFLNQADIHEYGVWIARDKKCDCFSRVELIGNPVFAEFLELIKLLCSENNVSDREKYLRPEITQDLFQIACDPVDGNSISFRDGPRICRCCGSKEFASGLSQPLCTVEVKTFDVTYDSWNRMTREDRKQLVFDALASIWNEKI